MQAYPFENGVNIFLKGFGIVRVVGVYGLVEQDVVCI